MVTIEQINRGVASFIDREIASKVSGINKFFAYFIIPSVPSKVNELITKYEGFLHPYIDSNGNIDLDTLYTTSKQAMRRTLQFEYAGILFKESDIDVLYKLILES